MEDNLMIELVGLCDCGVSLDVNMHKNGGQYQPADCYISDNYYGELEDMSADVVAGIKRLDTLVILQAYCDNHVGFFIVIHHDIEAAIKEMIGIVKHGTRIYDKKTRDNQIKIDIPVVREAAESVKESKYKIDPDEYNAKDAEENIFAPLTEALKIVHGDTEGPIVDEERTGQISIDLSNHFSMSVTDSIGMINDAIGNTLSGAKRLGEVGVYTGRLFRFKIKVCMGIGRIFPWFKVQAQKLILDRIERGSK